MQAPSRPPACSGTAWHLGDAPTVPPPQLLGLVHLADAKRFQGHSPGAISAARMQTTQSAPCCPWYGCCAQTPISLPSSWPSLSIPSGCQASHSPLGLLGAPGGAGGLDPHQPVAHIAPDTPCPSQGQFPRASREQGSAPAGRLSARAGLAPASCVSESLCDPVCVCESVRESVFMCVRVYEYGPCVCP